MFDLQSRAVFAFAIIFYFTCALVLLVVCIRDTQRMRVGARPEQLLPYYRHAPRARAATGDIAENLLMSESTDITYPDAVCAALCAQRASPVPSLAHPVPQPRTPSPRCYRPPRPRP
jgi:hypothetical protein